MRRFVLLMIGLSPIIIVTIVLGQAVAAQQPEDPTKGVIYGTVIDQNGQPAKELGLTAYPLGVGLGAILPYTKTDQNGEFHFVRIPWWGRYTVFADDEEAGYSLSATGLNPTKSVTLSPEQPEAEFNLVLPPKAGFLKIHLTNQKTGEPIKAVQVTVMSADNPKSLVFSQSCSSTRTILVPPDKNLFLHVTSWGFREWSEGAGDGKSIRIHSGSRLTLEVELDPAD
ncbi:MAG: hypothetical protein JOY95_06400 [Silvibacterium sp.]|nr:hypothetical protein [Silvibacterium sp.]